jgi:hypothetical protein
MNRGGRKMTVSLWGLRYGENRWVRIREHYDREKEPEVHEATDFDVILLFPSHLDPRKFEWYPDPTRLGWYRYRLYDEWGVPLEDIEYECYVWVKTANGFAWVETTLENALAQQRSMRS